MTFSVEEAQVFTPLPKSNAADAPIRIGLISTGGKKGAKAFATIEKTLKKQTNVLLLDPDALKTRAKQLDFELDDLRKADNRIAKQQEIKSLMGEFNLELLLILDVFGKGKRTQAQLVTLDFEALQMGDERANASRGRLKTKDAEQMVTTSINNMVPTLQDHRARTRDLEERIRYEKEAAKNAPPPPVPLAYKEEDKGSDPIKGSTELGESEVFRATALFLVGRDSTSIADSIGNKIQYNANYIGAALLLGGRFLHFTDSIHLGASLFGGYAPFKTVDSANSKQSSYKAFAQLQLEPTFDIGSYVRLVVLVGGDFAMMHINSSPQLDYLGATFIGARAGVEAQFIPMQELTIRVGGAFVPTFKNTITNGTYGNPSMVYGGEARLHLSYRPIPFLEIHAQYDFGYRTSKLDKEGRFSQEKPTFQEMRHMGTIGVGVVL